MLVMLWDLEVGQLALERNASPIQWTGGTVILSLAWKKLTFNEHQLWAR